MKGTVHRKALHLACFSNSSQRNAAKGVSRNLHPHCSRARPMTAALTAGSNCGVSPSSNREQVCTTKLIYELKREREGETQGFPPLPHRRENCWVMPPPSLFSLLSLSLSSCSFLQSLKHTVSKQQVNPVSAYRLSSISLSLYTCTLVSFSFNVTQQKIYQH